MAIISRMTRNRIVVGLAACLVLFAIVVTFGRGNGLNTEVSKRADHWLYTNGWTFYSPLYGPFAKLSEDEIAEIRDAKNRLQDATAYYTYGAWEDKGFSDWCGDMWRDSYFYALVVPKGVTYGELLELDRKYGLSTQSIEAAYFTLCFGHSTNWQAELLFSPPVFDGSSGQVTNPRVQIRNLGDNPIKTVTVAWEVGVLGRPGVVAEGNLGGKIVGGLLKNEAHGFFVGFDQEERSDLSRLRNRLGAVELFILACIESLERESNQRIVARSNCLETKKRESEARLSLAIAAPDIENLMAEPIMKSTLDLSSKEHFKQQPD